MQACRASGFGPKTVTRNRLLPTHLRNFNARDQLGKRPSEANRQTYVDVSLRVVRSTLFFALLLEPYDLVIREAPILIRRRDGVSSTAKEFI